MSFFRGFNVKTTELRSDCYIWTTYVDKEEKATEEPILLVLPVERVETQSTCPLWLGRQEKVKEKKQESD